MRSFLSYNEKSSFSIEGKTAFYMNQPEGI